MFNCQAEALSGRVYNQFMPSVECTMDGEWGHLVYLAVGFGLVYVAGIPVLFAVLLYRYRNRLEEYVVEMTIGFLYEDYRPQLFWFEVRRGHILDRSECGY